MDVKAAMKSRLQKRSGSNTETFVLQVARYEGDLVVGRRAGSDVELRVKLRADTQTERRLAVADYANQNPRNKHRVQPGGFLRVDSTYKGNDGIYMARWMQKIASSPDEGRPIEGMIRVSPKLPKGNGKGVYRTVEILTGEIHEPGTAGELKNAIRASVDGAGFAFVRLAIDDAQPRAWNISSAGDRSFAQSNSYQALMEVLADVPDNEPWPQGMVVEVLPAQRHFFGPEAALSPRLDVFVDTSESTGKQYSRGFTEGVVTMVRTMDSNYEFVGDAVPRHYEPKFLRLGPPTDSLSSQALTPAEQQLAVQGPAAGQEDFHDDELPDFDLSAGHQARIGDVPGTERRRPGM